MLKPAEQFALVPLDKTTGSIAEQTHFFIDYSKGYLVLCVEFHNNGPRLPDIEYYLRNVANEKLKLAKATETELFVDTNIDKALKSLKNVLNMEIKVQPLKLAKLDTALVGKYFTGINSIGMNLKPKYLKIETLFQTPGKGVKSSEINKEVNGMFEACLQKFQASPVNVDVFDHFVVKYEDKEGQEEVFNLIKGKKEVIKDIDLKNVRSDRAWYEIIEQDLNDFMESL